MVSVFQIYKAKPCTNFLPPALVPNFRFLNSCYETNVRGSCHAKYNSLLPFHWARESSESNNITQTTANFLVLRTEDIRTYQHSWSAWHVTSAEGDEECIVCRRL